MEKLLYLIAQAARKLDLYYGIHEVASFDAFVIENLRMVGDEIILADISLQIAPVNLSMGELV